MWLLSLLELIVGAGATAEDYKRYRLAAVPNGVVTLALLWPALIAAATGGWSWAMLFFVLWASPFAAIAWHASRRAARAKHGSFS